MATTIIYNMGISQEKQLTGFMKEKKIPHLVLAQSDTSLEQALKNSGPDIARLVVDAPFDDVYNVLKGVPHVEQMLSLLLVTPEEYYDCEHIPEGVNLDKLYATVGIFDKYKDKAATLFPRLLVDILEHYQREDISAKLTSTNQEVIQLAHDRGYFVD